MIVHLLIWTLCALTFVLHCPARALCSNTTSRNEILQFSGGCRPPDLPLGRAGWRGIHFLGKLCYLLFYFVDLFLVVYSPFYQAGNLTWNALKIMSGDLLRTEI